MEGEKHVNPQTLDNKTLPQLRELLDRQEKLASNQKLLNKLPDKGHKVLQFLETLRHVVEERQKLCTSSGREPTYSTSTAMPEFTARQTGGDLNPPVTSPFNTGHSNQQSSSGSQNLEAYTLAGGEITDTTADLSQCLENLTVSELAAPRMSSGEEVMVAPEDGGNLETRFPNSYETVMKRSAESGKKRSPFKPNSSLKISNIEELPENFKLKSKSPANELVTHEKAISNTASGKDKRPPEESAVQGPAYRFAGAKEIPIQDSIVLQKQQKEHLEKLKSIHAAEKLAERLNIRIGVYNPATVDMDYRSCDVTGDANPYDSDDVPDEEQDDDLS